MSEFFQSYAIWIILGLSFLVFLAMAPCHAIFLLPFVGLPLFWLLPLGYALPINLVIWLVTPFLFRVIRRAMKKAPADGFQSLIGSEAMVVSMVNQSYRQYIVKAGHELWTARSTETLRPGERVEVMATDGIKLVVARIDTENGREKK